jgi:hypothetical protein
MDPITRSTAREWKIEDRFVRSVVREMSISENYEGEITPIRSNISRFSRGTGGKGLPREGREEFRRRCTLIASPQLPFVCSETNELGEELVGSCLYQVHLHHELEFNVSDRSCQATMHI